MDYVDLYQIHRFDRETPIEETLEALTDLIRIGKVRYIGASTMAAYQLAKMLYRADQLHLARFISMQNNYSLLYREEEREMIPLCREEGIGLIPYSPIGGGLLAGSRRTHTVRSHSPMARNRFNRKADEAVIDAVADSGRRPRRRPGADRRGVAARAARRQLLPSSAPAGSTTWTTRRRRSGRS